MSVALIQRFGRTVKVVRPGALTYVNGIQTPAEGTELNIIGSVQPMTAREQEFLPEGNDNKESIKVYTTELLKIQDNDPSLGQADILEIDEKRFQVIAVENFFYPGTMRIQFYKAIASFIGRVEA